MNRVTRRLLLTPRLLKPVSKSALKISNSYSILCKSRGHLFSSQAANSGKEDPLASFKCYTIRDPDSSYYVIEPSGPSGGLKAPPTRAHGRPAPVETDRPNIEHMVSVITNYDPRREVHLIGVGSDEVKAIRDVKEAMALFHPEVVFLELCEQRRQFLTLQKSQGSKAIQVHRNTLAATFKEATKSDTKIILGDRPFDVTVRRILESMLTMRIWEFTKLSFFLLFQFMEYGKDNKVFNINEFIRQKILELKVFPSLLKPIVHERDAYMSSVLAKVAHEYSTVVAIVGIDHIPGIKMQLKERFD